MKKIAIVILSCIYSFFCFSQKEYFKTINTFQDFQKIDSISGGLWSIQLIHILEAPYYYHCKFTDDIDEVIKISKDIDSGDFPIDFIKWNKDKIRLKVRNDSLFFFFNGQFHFSIDGSDIDCQSDE